VDIMRSLGVETVIVVDVEGKDDVCESLGRCLLCSRLQQAPVLQARA